MTEAQTNGAGAQAPSPTGHSRFGASSAHRWTVCHGSIAAQADKPNENSSFAIEGTACHTVAGLCLEGNQDAIEYVGRMIAVEDAESVEFDEHDHAEGVQVYLDTIRGDEATRGGKLHVEVLFHLKALHPDFWGTADCVRLGSDGILSVYDLKMGRGKIVEVVEVKDGVRKINKQLGFYALGALAYFDNKISDDKQVELVVVQPRAAHRDGCVRRAVCTVGELKALGRELVAAANKCREPNPALVAGDHCTFCKAAATCPALRSLAMDTAQLDFDDDTGVARDAFGNIKMPEPMDLTPQQLANVLDATEVIDAWIKSVRFHAQLVANGGHPPTGWKLVNRQARRKWKDEAKAASDLCLVFGLDESSIMSHKLKSPAQVEKLLPKPERETLQKSNLYSADSSGTTLVRESDKRSEAQPASQADFDDGVSDPIAW
jgi:Protein of unknown function (DUF2800)